MKKKRLAGSCLFVLILATLAGCATDPGKVEERQKMYETNARVNDKVAEDWRKSANEDMAVYHEQEAKKARHNRFAAGCDTTSSFIFTILLGSDACEIK